VSQENVEVVRAFVEAAGRDSKHGQRYLAAGCVTQRIGRSRIPCPIPRR
jgi:hypothetical protein